MTDNQLFVLLYLFAIATRVPRLKERWAAPLMRGPAWLFDIAVPPDFLRGPGQAILRRYRWRLFLPWAIEIPILAAILLAGRPLQVLWLVVVIALFTRFNYYAARLWAGNQARRFEAPEAARHVSTVALSLEPRNLAGYTKASVEAVIAVALGASFGWFGYACHVSPDPLWSRLLNWTVINLYLQVGLLLIKAAIVRARSLAPAENTEQYLVWRDSLRRLTTDQCDSVRLLAAFNPLLTAVSAVTLHWNPEAFRWVELPSLFAVTVFAFRHEWRRRREHLEVARRTRPARLPVDTQEQGSFLCFRRGHPALLLRSPTGYALNLASATARMAGLYMAGFAGLWVLLMR
jgi:hypothetical protein